jgi:hypothetical protein
MTTCGVRGLAPMAGERVGLSGACLTFFIDDTYHEPVHRVRHVLGKVVRWAELISDEHLRACTAQKKQAGTCTLETCSLMAGAHVEQRRIACYR